MGTNLLDLDGSPAPPNPENVKLEGDSVPEALRGKTLKDLLDQNAALSSSLRTSEESRAQAVATIKSLNEKPATPAAPPPPAPPAPIVFDQEKWNKLNEEDPSAAAKYMFEVTQASLSQNIEMRMAPVHAASTQTAEQIARTKYKDDFEVIGREIEAIVAQIPPEVRDKSLSQPGAWDRVVEFARGQNIEKIVEHRLKKQGASGATTLDAAREEQARAAQMTQLGGGGGGGEMQSRTNVGVETSVPWDETTQEIARTLGFTSKEEYYKWMKA